uniref:Pentraxin fusion protein n=1 Tax=Columba livia TaxID=8932 RepID=R7VMS8_COLLI
MALPWALLLLSEVLAQDSATQSCLIPPSTFNAALGRPASQSSVFGNISIAANAVDGNRDGVWQHGSCSHTQHEREPWWSVDLGGRQPCCCGTITDAGPGSLSTICCSGLPGRYVSVLLPGRSAALVLCEVEVVLQGCPPLPAGDGGPGGPGDGSCAHTEKEPEPWWYVDLGARHAVYAVTVTNRRDCCWESLLGAQVHVGDSLVDHGKRNPVCGVILDTGAGSASTVCCNGLPGRYVSIIIPGREDFLVLCEVEVTVQSCVPPPGAQNLALRRPAAQSSTAGGTGDAINAVDGNRDGNWHRGSCSQTEREPEPCCGIITDTGPGSTSTVCCHGLRGKSYVTVAIPGREERLSLCEVEVVEHGCAALPGAQNVALGRPATQSSLLDATSGAGNAVDGNQDAAASSRTPAPAPPAPFAATAFAVATSPSSSPSGRPRWRCASTVCCHGLHGRYVTVTVPGREEQLALCEVEVYSVTPEL